MQRCTAELQSEFGPRFERILGAKGGLLCACALRCDLDAPPETRKAAVWLHADALSSGKLQTEDATLIMRALTLAQAEDRIPTELLETLAGDTARFVEDAGLVAEHGD